MPVKLERYSDQLKGICLIEEVGLSSNIYTIGENPITLIDTGVGSAPNKIIPKLKLLNLTLQNITQVIITHAHYDHIGGLAEILQTVTPKIMAHSADAKLIEEAYSLEVVKLKDEDTITTQVSSLKVIHTPGHTQGSICLYSPERKLLFSGDTVFADGGFGRTDLDTGDSEAMIKSLQHLTQFDVERLLPGHGDLVLQDAREHIKNSFEEAQRIL
jgi:glyoxylase-like metal-dependent hydrolase (beta-lactamase superfamily II)